MRGDEILAQVLGALKENTSALKAVHVAQAEISASQAQLAATQAEQSGELREIRRRLRMVEGAVDGDSSGDREVREVKSPTAPVQVVPAPPVVSTPVIDVEERALRRKLVIGLLLAVTNFFSVATTWLATRPSAAVAVAPPALPGPAGPSGSTGPR